MERPSVGADVIELGVPFSDPMADGSAIEAASVVAIKNGAVDGAHPWREMGEPSDVECYMMYIVYNI